MDNRRVHVIAKLDAFYKMYSKNCLAFHSLFLSHLMTSCDSNLFMAADVVSLLLFAAFAVGKRKLPIPNFIPP